MVVMALTLAVGGAAGAQNVKITPLGTHPGELCDRDRATIFEDPTGVRILYDAGASVTGPDDVRLGTVHVVLLSHAHGDHMGDMRLKGAGAGTCARPELVSAAPHSTTAEIAAAKNSALLTTIAMANFLGRKVENIRGKPTPACPQTGGALVAPLAEPCHAGLWIGGSQRVRAADATSAVEIAVVTAAHDSTVSRSLLSDPERKSLEADNVSLTLGPSTGYVIKFTNGLVVYLSGDTGLHAEMKSIVADYYRANLMVLNLGPTAVTMHSAAYAVNEFVRPAAVIASHPNEAATAGGKVRDGSRMAAFVAGVSGRPVHMAISGRTMEFDASAKCVAGCQ
jgi:L-ascorbate metabolism protein UlaG (beta-lactamase superfamily)